MPIYDGAFDVALEEDVIIVTINYRRVLHVALLNFLTEVDLNNSISNMRSLEAFGFLAGQALIDESSDGSVGNYGFQVCLR